jgi:DNA-binding response OmpR family regulator
MRGIFLLEAIVTSDSHAGFTMFPRSTMRSVALDDGRLGPSTPAGVRRILLAEDDRDLRNLVKRRLETGGFHVTPHQALNTARASHPDLCLLDIAMPNGTGLDVLQALRADPQTARMKVIMLTGRAQERDVVRALALGADDYITKPFSPRELLRRVQAHLNTA